MSKKKNPHVGSALDDFLKEKGLFENAQALAVKEVIAWQLAQAMQERKLSKARMAELLHTSRTQVNRLLNPAEGNVTLETLQRAADAVGRKLHLELV
ncbi:MAG: helix-turn-helix domain-containing protein [Gammaproteobacteria bacterium]|nr:helix-turn-helix domain-containing protein [Gammaproteobacteria bacterium]